MRWGHVWQLSLKELWSLARDPGLLGFIFFAFTVSIYAGATALPETLNQATLAIVDEDQSPLSARIVNAFYRPYFLPPTLVTAAEMDTRMDAGLDTFALNIPPDFQRDVLQGRSPAIQLNVDATRMSQAFNGSGYVQAIVDQEIREFVEGHRGVPPAPVDLALRMRFNPQLNKSWFGAVMKLIDQVTMLAIILTGAALIRERERGTIEHLLVMPVTPLEIMVSKVMAMGLVVLGTSALSLQFVVRGALGVPIEGSIGLFLAGVTLHLFATTSLGIFLGTIARSMPQFGLLMMLTLLPLQMLSGSMTPRESMPLWVQYVMFVAPNTHFVMLAQAILYRGANLQVVWPQFLALIVIGSLLFAVTWVRLRSASSTMT